MPRLRCPRCDHVFPKPEGTPVCPSCAYGPSPLAPARQPTDADPTPEAPVRDEGSSAAGAKREAKRKAKWEAKQKARQEATEARNRRKAQAKTPLTAQGSDKEGQDEKDGGRPPRRFFGKKKVGKRVPALLTSAFTTLLIATLLPFAGSFDLQGQDASIDVATGHFVLQRTASTNDLNIQPYLTTENAGVETDGARLGESILIGGLVAFLVVLVFGYAKRPGLVVVGVPVVIAILLAGSFVLQGALDAYPGNLFALGPSGLVGGAIQAGLAAIFALFYALKRPQSE